MNHEQAKDALSLWKHEQIEKYAYGFLLAGFRELDLGRNYFGSDNVDDEWQPKDGESRRSVPGSAIAMLRNAGCVADHFSSIPERGVFGGRRKSLRTSRNAAKVPTYRLIVGVAREWMGRKGYIARRGQLEMAGI